MEVPSSTVTVTGLAAGAALAATANANASVSANGTGRKIIDIPFFWLHLRGCEAERKPNSCRRPVQLTAIQW
jgi:hypothetical protein